MYILVRLVGVSGPQTVLEHLHSLERDVLIADSHALGEPATLSVSY